MEFQVVDFVELKNVDGLKSTLSTAGLPTDPKLDVHIHSLSRIPKKERIKKKTEIIALSR